MYSQNFDGFGTRDFGKANDRPLGPTEGLVFDTDCVVNPAARYHVKGIILPGNLVALYGPSGVGKTFVALRIAYAVARGEPVFNRRVQAAAVLYVGLEGQAGVATRMIGAASEYGSAGNMLAQLTLSVALSKAEGEAGVKLIVDRVRAHGALARHAVGLVIIDTVHRALAGDDENSAADMSAFIARLSAITAQTGAAVLAVHHCGKDVARGMRGSSSLFAACDGVIGIDEAKCITLEKVKDGADGPLCSYALKLVQLGVDADGDPITTCTVEILADAKRTSRSTKLGDKERRALDMLNRLYAEEKDIETRPEEIDLAGMTPAEMPRVVAMKDWRDKCATANLSSGNERAQDRAFERARDKLVSAGKIQHYGDKVWAIGTKRQDATSHKNPENTGLRPHATTCDNQRQMSHDAPSKSCDRQRHHPIGVSRVVATVEHPAEGVSEPLSFTLHDLT